MTLPFFLRPSYWFAFYPLPLQPMIGKLILIVMLALLCIGIGVSFYAHLALRRDKAVQRAWRWIGTATLWAGITGLYLYAMSWQQIPVLGMRAWYLVWFVLFAWIIARGFIHLLRDIPANRRAEAGRASYEKWLPKPKK